MWFDGRKKRKQRKAKKREKRYYADEHSLLTSLNSRDEK